ncbi:hypothetical protein GPK34_01020 [Secundilactobacillus kimchicus]|uniref:hypothetical protein n=1 Tax=Secundilactobacillus kimchicus TaxID=528209 RepID=UPI001C02B46F|nr:hypothetical protein [Secundilactobacillus kimchicus]MBT9670619.1 hypothetical protein [Secundilactobacillus kimchicus]
MIKLVFLENSKGQKSYIKSFNSQTGYMAFTPDIKQAQRCDDETVSYYKRLGGSEFTFCMEEVSEDGN